MSQNGANLSQGEHVVPVGTGNNRLKSTLRQVTPTSLKSFSKPIGYCKRNVYGNTDLLKASVNGLP